MAMGTVFRALFMVGAGQRAFDGYVWVMAGVGWAGMSQDGA